MVTQIILLLLSFVVVGIFSWFIYVQTGKLGLIPHLILIGVCPFLAGGVLFTYIDRAWVLGLPGFWQTWYSALIIGGLTALFSTGLLWHLFFFVFERLDDPCGS